jgi:hypothetical protein
VGEARRKVLALNAELRKLRPTGALPDHSGHAAFFIPEEDFWRLVKGEVVKIDHVAQKAYVRRPQYPELLNADPVIARRELERLLREHPEYRINPHEGKRGAPFHRGVIVR